jgi:hypothetical protein
VFLPRIPLKKLLCVFLLFFWLQTASKFKQTANKILFVNDSFPWRGMYCFQFIILSVPPRFGEEDALPLACSAPKSYSQHKESQK